MSSESDLDLLRASVRQMLERSTRDDAHAPTGFDAEAWSALDDSGVARVGIPEELGGEGGTTVDFGTVLSTAGYHAARVPLADNWLACWLSATAGLGGGPGVQSVHLPADLAAGAPVFGPGPVVSGLCRAVPWAADADRLVIVGVDADDHPTAGTIGTRELTAEAFANLAGEPRADLVLDRHPVESSAAISVETVDEARLRAALAHSCLMAGALRRVVELSVAFSIEREQFGRRIGTFQAIQRLLSLIAEEAAAAEAISEAACEQLDDGRPLVCAAAKVRTSKAANRAAVAAHQVHGAIGFTDEHRLKDYTTRLWSWRDEAGDELTWSRYLGDRLLLDGSSFWESVTEHL